MRTIHSASRLAIASLALTMAGWLAPACPARADDAAKLMPPDTILYMAVPDVKALAERFKKTGYYALYKDPAMQPFVGPAEKKITEKIEEGLAEAWSEIGLEQKPEKLPWPQGRIAFALKLKSVTHKFSYPGQEGEPITHEYKSEQPRIVVLADMGENAELAGKLIKKAADKAVEDGHARRTRESVRGVELEIFTEPPPKPGEEQSSGASEPEAACYAFKGTTLVGGNDVQMVKDVLARMSGADLPSLADEAGLKAVRTGVGGDGDFLIYFNPQALIDFFKANAPADDKEEIIKMVQVLGFDNVTGLGITFEAAPNDKIDFRVKAQVAIRGEPRGIAALAIPPNAPTQPGALLTKGLASFLVLNYDPARIYDQVLKMVEQSTGENVEKDVQEAMAMTGGEGAGGRPPVNLKTEVIGQLTAPVLFMMQINKPYAAPDSSQWLLAGRVRDAKVLDGALARIHEAFIARGNKEMRRELNNTNVYLLPGMAGNLMGALMMGGRGMGGEDEASQGGLSVAGDFLVGGSLKWVEQSVRDLRGERPEGIAADPMYRYAAQFLPAQAGGFMYENHQVTMAQLWDQFKAAAKEAGAAGEGNQPPARLPEDFQVSRRQGVSPAGAMATPMGTLVQMLGEYVDFNALPEFSVVKKHFGAGVAYISGNGQGLYLEGLTIKAPPGQ